MASVLSPGSQEPHNCTCLLELFWGVVGVKCLGCCLYLLGSRPLSSAAPLSRYRNRQMLCTWEKWEAERVTNFRALVLASPSGGPGRQVGRGSTQVWILPCCFCAAFSEPSLFTCIVTLKGCVNSDVTYVCKGFSRVSDRYSYLELLFGLWSLWERIAESSSGPWAFGGVERFGWKTVTGNSLSLGEKRGPRTVFKAVFLGGAGGGYCGWGQGMSLTPCQESVPLDSPTPDSFCFKTHLPGGGSHQIL